MWYIGRASETRTEGYRFEPRYDLFRNYYFCILRHQINNTNCVSFVSFTVTVKHVVGGRNKQVLPQWICLRCNIQFDNMGSVIFFECSSCLFTSAQRIKSSRIFANVSFEYRYKIVITFTVQYVD
jgi:hypothetical protein